MVSVRAMSTRQLKSSVTTKWLVQLVQKQTLSPQRDLLRGRLMPESVMSTGSMTVPLTLTWIMLGIGQWILTTMQFSLMPRGFRFWIWYCILTGGMAVKVKLQVLLSFTSERNRPNLWFWGSLPSQSHSLQPLVRVVQLPPSQVRLTGHMILVLKSGATDWQASVAMSVRVQMCEFMGELKTHPDQFDPKTVLLGTMVPVKPRKSPVQSTITKLLLPVQRMSPQPPNHPIWLGLFSSAQRQLLLSLLRTVTLKRLVSATESKATLWPRKMKLLRHWEATEPRQVWLKLSKVTLVMQTLLSQSSCLQITSQPGPNLLGSVSPLAETVRRRIPMLLAQGIALFPQQQAQLGLETAEMQESVKMPVWLEVPSPWPNLRVAPRLLSTITKFLQTMLVVEMGPQICPICEAQALMQEKALHSSEVGMLLKMNPTWQEPAVLPLKGLVSSSLHLMWGKAKPCPCEPRQKLFWTATLSVAGLTQSQVAKQAMSSFPKAMVGRSTMPMKRLSVNWKLEMVLACTPKTHPLQKTLLVKVTFWTLLMLTHQALQLMKEVAVTVEVQLGLMMLRNWRAEAVVSYCPPSTMLTESKFTLPTRWMSPSMKPQTSRLTPQPQSGPGTICTFLLRWPTWVFTSMLPLGVVIGPELPQWLYWRAGETETDPLALTAVMVTDSYSEQMPQEGERAILSPTCQSALAATQIMLSPAKAGCVSEVRTVAGETPQRLRLPVTMMYLLPATSGSMYQPWSSFVLLTWMVNLCIKGAEGEPAVTLPALMKMDRAVMLTSRVSSATRVPSIMRQLAGAGSMSRRTVQLPLTVTLSIAAGTVPLGHCEALLQRRVKGSFTKVPAGAGQWNMQMTALTSVYSKVCLFLPLWQMPRCLAVEFSLLWKYSPLVQVAVFRVEQLAFSEMQFAEVSRLPPSMGPTLKSSRLSVQLNLKMTPASLGVQRVVEAMEIWLKSMPVPHQTWQICPATQGSDQASGFSFMGSILLNLVVMEVQSELLTAGSTTSSREARRLTFMFCPLKVYLSSGLVMYILRMVMVWSQMMALSHFEGSLEETQCAWWQLAMWLQLDTIVADVLAMLLPSNGTAIESSKLQMMSRFMLIMKRQLPLNESKVRFLMNTSVPRLVKRSMSSHMEQVMMAVLPTGQLQNRVLVMLVWPVLGVMTAAIPFVQLEVSASTLLTDWPMMAQLLTETISLVKLAMQNSTPLLQFSAMVKLLNMTLPVCSASTPSSRFLQMVKLWKTEGEEGLLNQGSLALESFRTGLHGFFLEQSLKILRPKRVLECATLLATQPSGFPMGQTSLVALGPSGLDLISYQMPQKSPPAAWLPQKSLVGLVTQKEATDVSVWSMLVTASELMARLFLMVLWVSMPSSTKKLWPLTLQPTLFQTVRRYTPWMVTTLAKDSCTALPRTKEVGTSAAMWKCMQYLPKI